MRLDASCHTLNTLLRESLVDLSIFETTNGSSAARRELSTCSTSGTIAEYNKSC